MDGVLVGAGSLFSLFLEKIISDLAKLASISRKI